MSPVQRIPSGEVMESLANGTVTSRQSGNARKPVFKWSDGATAQSQKTTFVSSGAGKTQLVICVAGIYASLYGSTEPCINFDAHTFLQSIMGPPARAHHQNPLPQPSCHTPRSQSAHRILPLSHRPQYGPVILCLPCRRYLSIFQ